MKTLNLSVSGITITLNHSESGASISSNMPAADIDANSEFNAAVDAIESMILAHHCAGINVSDTAYLEGIGGAYEALCNAFDVEDS